jgi:hypothetical protein
MNRICGVCGRDAAERVVLGGSTKMVLLDCCTEHAAYIEEIVKDPERRVTRGSLVPR